MPAASESGISPCSTETLVDRINGLQALMESLSEGQDKILDRLDSIALHVTTCASAAGSSPRDHSSNQPLSSRLSAPLTRMGSLRYGMGGSFRKTPNPGGGGAGGGLEQPASPNHHARSKTPESASTPLVTAPESLPATNAASPVTPAPLPTTRPTKVTEFNIVKGTASARIQYTDAPYRQVLHLILASFAIWEYLAISSSVARCPFTDNPDYLIGMFVVSTIFHVVDVVLNFFTTQPHPVNKWEVLDDLKLCRKRYLKGWFAFDALTIFPLDLLALAISGNNICTEICFEPQVTAMSVLKWARIFHIFRIPTYFRRRNPLMNTPRYVHAIFFLCTCTLILQTVSVLWMLVANDVEEELDGETFIYEWVAGFNWAFESIIHGNWGYRHHHIWVQVYTMMVPICGFLVVVVFQAKLAEFFVNQDPFKVWATQRREQLASLIASNGVPWEIQKNIMALYPTLLQANMRQFYNVMDDLPPFLAHKITMCMKLRLISKVPMFARESEECRTALADILVEEVLTAETDICTQGEVATSMYFLMHGLVGVIINKDGNELLLTMLKEGSWFGEIALLTDTTRTATIRAATAITVYRLEKADFNLIATKYPSLKEQIEKVAKERMNTLQKPEAPHPPPSPPPDSPTENQLSPASSPSTGAVDLKIGSLEMKSNGEALEGGVTPALSNVSIPDPSPLPFLIKPPSGSNKEKRASIIEAAAPKSARTSGLVTRRASIPSLIHTPRNLSQHNGSPTPHTPNITNEPNGASRSAATAAKYDPVPAETTQSWSGHTSDPLLKFRLDLNPSDFGEELLTTGRCSSVNNRSTRRAENEGDVMLSCRSIRHEELEQHKNAANDDSVRISLPEVPTSNPEAFSRLLSEPLIQSVPRLSLEQSTLSTTSLVQYEGDSDRPLSSSVGPMARKVGWD